MSAPLVATSQPTTQMAAATMASSTAAASSSPGVDSALLLNGQKAVTIHHNGALYRLQATRLGKLILTK